MGTVLSILGFIGSALFAGALIGDSVGNTMATMRVQDLAKQANELREKINASQTLNQKDINRLNSILARYNQIAQYIDPRVRAKLDAQINNYEQNINTLSDANNQLAAASSAVTDAQQSYVSGPGLVELFTGKKNFQQAQDKLNKQEELINGLERKASDTQ